MGGGEFLHDLVDIDSHAHLGKNFFRPLLRLSVVDQTKTVHAVVGEKNVLTDGEGGDKAELLENHANAQIFGRNPFPLFHLNTVDGDVSAVGDVQALKNFDQGGFSGAVFSDEGVDFAEFDSEIHPRQDSVGAEGLFNALHGQCCCHE